MKKVIKKIINWVKDHWIWLLILTLILGGIGWWQWSKLNPPDEIVEIINPQRKNFSSYLEVSGNVKAKEVARLRFLTGGKIVYLSAKQGDQVKKFQTIASLDKASLQKQLEQNLIAYEKQRYDFEQFIDDNIQDKALNDRVERNARKNQLSLENSVLSVEIQDIVVKNSYLTAPFAGILTSSPTNVAGVQVSGADYFEIVNPDTLYFSAFIEETDVAKVKVGQNVKVNLDAFTNESFESQIESISYQSVESSSGTQFEIGIPIPEIWRDRLRLGLNGDAQILLESVDNALVIPISSTIFRDGKTYVSIQKDDGNTEEKEIELGIESEDEVVVIEGIDENDRIVLPK